MPPPSLRRPKKIKKDTRKIVLINMINLYVEIQDGRPLDIIMQFTHHMTTPLSTVELKGNICGRTNYSPSPGFYIYEVMEEGLCPLPPLEDHKKK